MADLNVERREGAPWWLWILGLVLLALLAFWLIGEMGNDDEVALTDPVAMEVEPAPVVEPVEPTGQGMPAGVESYLSSCGDRAPQQMALDHQYTGNCVEQLVTALEGVVAQSATPQSEVQTELAEARQAADRLTQSAEQSEQHSEMVHTAFVEIAEAMSALQAGQTPATQADGLTQIANSVDPGQLLLEQGEAVQNFFAESAEQLRAVTGAGPTGIS